MKYPMRKAKRQVCFEEILEIIGRCDVCRIGLFDGAFPYIVPMNFGFEVKDGSLMFYFHCATEGRKLEILKRNDNVCFELDTSHELRTGPLPCNYSMNYECVMGEGRLKILEGRSERQYALARLVTHYGKTGPLEWSEKALASTCVLCLTVSSVSGKRLKK